MLVRTPDSATKRVVYNSDPGKVQQTCPLSQGWCAKWVGNPGLIQIAREEEEEALEEDEGAPNDWQIGQTLAAYLAYTGV